ncbi:protein serine/threonine phosphatase 2C [Lentinus tigrinus ALCF2SS1-7]|uniref:protein-serine/threonine phosphatase n=1 Tax=Lentinus tigrinus ALCF2SS1-6 TaxID=1328759 RepID=A0A5C2SBR1_9APHY|nr:protein serine/threonine phosphatase 2C [Lentinus tigrinus ALCF2SS1-6]RPD75267.1 protein serine/threonine phosphatase 2C [Lentinus tigrinus ALCF2SS1-7]
MSGFEEVRTKLVHYCSSKKVDIGRVARIHAVTFQPLESRKNEDRLVTRELVVHGQEWLLLAVCDGHCGASAARYTASHLPSRIRSMLEHLAGTDLQGQLDRKHVLKHADFISSELRRCINDFDRELGHVVETICPNPTKISEKEACSLVKEYPDVLARACSGTTLAAALVNLTHRLMWAINVGDSTVALSTADSKGKRIAHELCTRHTLNDLREYKDVVRRHIGERRVVESGRVLGMLAMSRVIGDYPLKMHAAYTRHLFRYLSIVGAPPYIRNSMIRRIRTPPYVTADPSVCFVDLQALWNRDPIIMVYSDGIDNLVNGCRYLNPFRETDIIPARAISVLLQDEVDDDVEELLGYGIDLHWSGEEANRAVDVLGNLLGGTDTSKLQLVVNQDLLADQTVSPSLYIDDTSLVLCSFARESVAVSS